MVIGRICTRRHHHHELKNSTNSIPLFLFLLFFCVGLLHSFPVARPGYGRQQNNNTTNHREADYTIGIFQSIGFKEFHDYLVLPSSEQTSETGKMMLEQGVEALKVRTRRYARQQIKWIRKRFLQQPDRQVGTLSL